MVVVGVVVVVGLDVWVAVWLVVCDDVGVAVVVGVVVGLLVWVVIWHLGEPRNVPSLYHVKALFSAATVTSQSSSFPDSAIKNGVPKTQATVPGTASAGPVISVINSFKSVAVSSQDDPVS